MKLHHHTCSGIFSLQSLLKSGFSPTPNSIHRFLCYLYHHQKFNTILHLYSQLKTNKIQINHGPFPSSSTFTSLIHRFVANREMDKAIEVLEIMTNNKEKYPFDNFVTSSVISGFCRIGKPELGLGFFNTAVDKGALLPNIVTYTTLVTALCKLGKLDEVKDLVKRLEQDERFEFDCVFYTNWIHNGGAAVMELDRDVVSYSILIDRVSKEGNIGIAFGLLGKMMKEGIEPNLITFTSIVRGLCKKGNLEEAFALFDRVLSNGIEVDEFVYVTLIDGVCKKGDLNKAFSLLVDMEERGIKPSILTYNTVINGLCKAGRVSEADEISKGVLGDVVTYTTLLDSYIKEENIDAVLEIRRRFVQAEIPMDLVMCNILLKAFLLVGEYGEAEVLYKAMPEMDLTPNIITYTIMIKGYCKMGHIEEALEMFNEMVGKGLTVTSLSTIIKTLVENHRALDAYSLLLNAGEDTLRLIDIVDYTIVVNGLCKEGFMLKALDLCNLGKKRGITLNIVTHNTIINGLCQQGCIVEALRLFDSLKNVVSLVPTKVTYGILIDNLCKEGLFLDAERLLDRMVFNGLVPNVIICNSVIDGYCKLGLTEDAMRVLSQRMVTADAFTVSSLIKGYCKKGEMEEALRVFTEFNKSADFLGFLYLIKGLSTKGRMEEARTVLREMLVSKSIVKIVNRVDEELVESESIKGFLIELCEQGRVSQAIKILDEISSTIYLSSKNSGSGENDIYSTVSSLCSNGKMKEANEFVMSVLSCMHR